MEPIIRSPAIAATTRQLRRSVTAVAADTKNQSRGGQPQPQSHNKPQTQPQTQPQPQPQPQPAASLSTGGAAPGSVPAPPNFGNRPPSRAAPVSPVPPASFAAEPVVDESATVYEAALAQLALEQQQQQSAQYLILQKQREAELVQAKSAAERLGYAEGVAQGERAAQKRLTEQVAQLVALMAQVQAARQEVVNGAEDIIVDLAFGALCRILGEGADQRAMVTGMVQQVLLQFRQQEPLVVLLHPQDLALVQQNLPELGIDPEQTQFRADPALKMGGCMVESSVGTLDARLETQLSRLRETLLQVRRGEEYAGEAL